MDKKLVAACDLGGLHPPRPCSFSLDNYEISKNKTFALVKNNTYVLDVYNAERHTDGSNFRVTTSILPKNILPISSNTTQTVNGPSDTTFALPVYDGNADPLIITVYPPYPQYGSIITEKDTITSNSTALSYTTSKYSLRYVANNLYIGYTKIDTIYYSVTDHCATVGTYSVSITVVGNLVQTVFLPPVLQPTLFVNLTRGEIKSLNLTAADPQNKPLFYLDDTVRSGIWSNCINVLGLDLNSGLFTFQGILGDCLFSYLVSNKVIDPPTQGFVQIHVIQPYVPPVIEQTIYQQPVAPQPTDEVVINIVPNNSGIPGTFYL
jgi:fibro-slime domain-containing protein